MTGISEPEIFELCMSDIDRRDISALGEEWLWRSSVRGLNAQWSRSRAGEEQTIEVYTSGDQPRYMLRSPGDESEEFGLLSEAADKADQILGSF